MSVKRKRKPSKAIVKQILDDAESDDLPDGAYWQICADRLGLKCPTDVMEYVSNDPSYFGYRSNP